MAANLTNMISLLSNMRVPQGVNPVTVRLPPPPALVGPLAPNDYLTKAQPYVLNAISGPESMVVVNRYIYTGLKDGWIVEIKPSGQVRKILRMSIRSCGQPGAGEDACGRPLGLRADSQGYLVVADAYNGIFRVHPTTGQFRQLVDSRNQVVNGRPIRYINDLAVAKDGTIYFSSSSTKWKPSEMLNIMFEGETTGRVLVYNPHELLAARRVQELVTNLHYPNGLQLSPDESFILIGEGGRCKIHRAWIARNSPKFGSIETFAENLPGNVDNIRLSPRGTYWVGLSRARHSNLPSVMDSYGEQPEVRRNLIALVSNKMVFDDPHFGIVVELNSQGQIVRSLQDPSGSKYTSISEVEEEKGLLFIGSKSKNYIGIIDMNILPSPESMDPGSDLLPNVADVDLKFLLSRVSKRLQQLTEQKVRSIVLLLVRELYEAKLQAKQAQEEVSKLRQELDYIRLQTTGGGYPTGTLPGGGSAGDYSGSFPGSGPGGDYSGSFPGSGPGGDYSGSFPGGGTGGDLPGTYPGEGLGTPRPSTTVGSVTDWPIGGGGIPTSPIPETTTATSFVTSSTTDSGAVAAPDMGGSSALTGSVDGGVVGGNTVATTGAPSGATVGGGGGGGETTTAQATTLAVNLTSQEPETTTQAETTTSANPLNTSP